MTWSDLTLIPKQRGSAVPLVTISRPRRELAYLNAAARHALGNPEFIRWQHTDDGRIGIVRADFIGEDSGGRRYRVDRNGYVTCTPVLPLLNGTPVTLKLALDGERLVVVAKVQR